MVEVFSTNIKTKKHTEGVLDRFRKEYPTYRINFDLEDCDNILRVESQIGQIDVDGILSIVKISGFYAEVMPDVAPSKTEK